MKYLTPQYHPSWEPLFSQLSPCLERIDAELNSRSDKTIYPPRNDIFTAFARTSLEKVRVIILGQDPYHGKDQAHGLAFSVPDGTAPPPSLKNILKEYSRDLDTPVPSTGDLTPWAKQGVLLLNTILTVSAGEPASHRKIGWETFTSAVLQKLSGEKRHLVFILWGSHARKKAHSIDSSMHTILTAPHPSPLSAYRGFFNSRPFSSANMHLKKHNQSIIDWRLS
ncbi:MAG: uracil-DNA glycosylase [Fibrobacterota bacterium]